MDWEKIKPQAATVYRAAISLGAQEAQLIWTRYTGFIIMNGFLITALSNGDIRKQNIILALLGVIALILNCIWHTLNYAGWRNQHLFYCQAGNLLDSNIGLLTDHFKTRDFKHGGLIYWLAQTIPTMFSLIAIPCLGIAASWVIGVVLWLVFAGAVLFVEYKLIAKQAVIEPA